MKKKLRLNNKSSSLSKLKFNPFKHERDSIGRLLKNSKSTPKLRTRPKPKNSDKIKIDWNLLRIIIFEKLNKKIDIQN